nr:ParA family protein [Ornithinimicrobium sediminis]
MGWPADDGVSRDITQPPASEEQPGPQERLAQPEPGDVSRETGRAAVAQAAPETPPTPTATDEVSRETPRLTPLARAVADEARRRKALEVATTERPVSTRIFTVANQKGGVGKTTTTVNLAAALAQLGMRVLVIDMDPQGNASTALGVPHHAGVSGIYDVLIDGLPLADVVRESSSVAGLWCAPATIDLAGAEIELVPLVARESRLRKALRAFLSGHSGEQRFDFVFVDCPPSLGLLTVNAFVAAVEVLIPIQCEYYALEGVSQLLTNIEMIREHLNPDLDVSTILMTMYDARTRLSAQVADEVRQHFPQQVVKTVIPRSVRVSEAPSHGETVMTYDPHSTGALSYREVAVELTSPRASPDPSPQPEGASRE